LLLAVPCSDIPAGATGAAHRASREPRGASRKPQAASRKPQAASRKRLYFTPMPKPTDADVRDLIRVLSATGAVTIQPGRENAVVRQYQTLMGSVDALSAVALGGLVQTTEPATQLS
jgi:hypothetical protein